MSRTGLDPATLARSLRRMAGDGSVEWVHEPIQASVLCDVADALDENEKLFALLKHESEQVEELRELVLHMYTCMGNVDADGNHECFSCEYEDTECDFAGRMAQLGIGVGE